MRPRLPSPRSSTLRIRSSRRRVSTFDGLPAELTPRSPLARLIEEALRFMRKGFARVAEFAPTRLNFSWITDDLAIGGAFHGRDIPKLKALGITAVVDCREEARDSEEGLAAHGIKLLHLPAPDAHEIDQSSIDQGVEWVTEQLADGAKVYVHSLHGVGRGPLLGCCVLIAEGRSASEALQLIKTRRWQ